MDYTRLVSAIRPLRSRATDFAKVLTAVCLPLWPSYLAGAIAAGFLWGNPPGTSFLAMPWPEQLASVGFTVVLWSNLALINRIPVPQKFEVSA